MGRKFRKNGRFNNSEKGIYIGDRNPGIEANVD
jgi:hypothetical protein